MFRAFIEFLRGRRQHLRLSSYERVADPQPKPGELWVFETHYRRFTARVESSGFGFVRISGDQWPWLYRREAVAPVGPQADSIE